MAVTVSADGDKLSDKPLERCSVFYYGVGHMLNDITSACWFTYLLVFLTEIGLPSRFVVKFQCAYGLLLLHFNCWKSYIICTLI